MPETLDFHVTKHLPKTILRLENENIHPKLLRVSPEYIKQLWKADPHLLERPVDQEHGRHYEINGLPVFIDPTLGSDPFVVAEGIPQDAPAEIRDRHARRIQARMAYLRGDDPFDDVLPLESAACNITDLLKEEMDNRVDQARALGEDGA